MTVEWIAEQRAKLKAEQDQAIGMANQAAGAMKMLDAVEAELKAIEALSASEPEQNA